MLFSPNMGVFMRQQMNTAQQPTEEGLLNSKGSMYIGTLTINFQYFTMLLWINKLKAFHDWFRSGRPHLDMQRIFSMLFIIYTVHLIHIASQTVVLLYLNYIKLLTPQLSEFEDCRNALPPEQYNGGLKCIEDLHSSFTYFSIFINDFL